MTIRQSLVFLFAACLTALPTVGQPMGQPLWVESVSAPQTAPERLSAGSAQWWLETDSGSPYFEPLFDGVSAVELADAWKSAAAMESLLGLEPENGSHRWIHGAEHGQVFPQWMAVSHLARVIDDAGADAHLIALLEKKGLSARGARSVVEILLQSRLEAAELEADLPVGSKARRVAGATHRSGDVESAVTATERLQARLGAADESALRLYLQDSVARALSVRFPTEDDGSRVMLTRQSNGQVRATYRGAFSGRRTPADLLGEACRQGHAEAGLPMDEEAIRKADAGAYLRDGASITCGGYGKSITEVEDQPVPDNSQVVGHTIPASMQCGDSVPVTVTLANTGTNTWTQASCYRLGSVGGYDPFFDSNIRFNLPAGSVAPTETVTFSFTLDAPATAGSYLTDWRMVAASHCDGVGWFGQIASQTVDVSCGPDAEVVSHTIPTNLYCGQQKTASITMENTGTTTWTSGGGVFNNSYQLSKPSGADPTLWYGSFALGSTESVAPGQTRTFTMNYRPQNGLAGTFVSDYQMRKGPNFFGEIGSESIQVTCNTDATFHFHTSGPLTQHNWGGGSASNGLTLTYTLRNSGTDPLIVWNPTAATTGVLEQLTDLPASIAPGGEADIQIRFPPQTPNVTTYGNIEVLTNQQDDPIVMQLSWIAYQ